MSNLPGHALVLLAALSFAPSPARAAPDETSNAQTSSPEPSNDEERWAAEEDPSQLEPPEKRSPEAASAGAKVMLVLRSGYGIAVGELAENGSELGEAVAGQVPIEFDIGALLRNGLFLGAYVQYGFGILGSTLASACDDAERRFPGTEVSCSAYDIRGGALLEYHFGAGKVRKATDPWLGFGVGYEYLSWNAAVQNAAEAATLTQSAEGFEYFSVHFGLDLSLADWFGLGPYAAFTMGSYGSASVSCKGDCEGVPSAEGDIAKPSLHSWTFFGARAVFQFDPGSVEPAPNARRAPTQRF